ncbi:phage portal protein [Chengkuizengella marina]|uniref:Phage portal protein n=1 Tax=Chengkuizengella marina TaxID=2507566 RepID=A0A6N9PZA0_9BACL|nr:phage portal protein [Chengkuizengella marina]NBI28206.1 phage portal protein [Chengkuizengella marina]
METIKNILQDGAASAMTLEQIINQEIDEWFGSSERCLMLDGERYYNGESDVLDKERLVIGEDGEQVEAENVANNKLVHNFSRKLTDQKVGYLLSKPLSIQTDDGAYGEEWNNIFNKSIRRLIQNVGKECINKGRAWMHVYYNQNGEKGYRLK